MALNRKSSILCQLYEKKHFTSKEFRRLCKYEYSAVICQEWCTIGSRVWGIEGVCNEWGRSEEGVNNERKRISHYSYI